MIAVHTVFVVVFVAGRAAEGGGVVRRVALVASVPFVLEPVLRAAVDRESRGSVDIVHGSESRRGRPCRLCMAAEAVVAQVQCQMIRRRARAVEIALMALVAVGVGQLVIAADMTVQTGHARMRTDEREVRAGMRECRGSPR